MMVHFNFTGIIQGLFSGYDIDFQNLIYTWLIFMLIVVAVCFIVSEITRNYSQVDKLWSLMPVAYCAITLTYSHSPRLYVMAALVALWGLRLSYNFYRKGGYSIIPWQGEEDYRWKIMREDPNLNGRFRFGLFNLLFISLYQNILILLFSSPLLLAARNPKEPLTFVDIVAALFMTGFIVIETIADNQQFKFHQLKKGKVVQKKVLYAGSLKKGFLTEGLWAYSRHPNFVSEQAIWICFYFFGAAASGKWINITLAGPSLLVLLFMGSSALTEKISSGKYPEYAKYRKEVPRFLPRLIRRSGFSSY